MSWRFCLFAGQTFPLDAEYPDVSKMWNDPDNIKWQLSANKLFCFGKNELETSVFAVTGTDTAFDATSQGEIPPDTILFVETRSSKTHWMEPGDFEIDSIPNRIDDPDQVSISGNFSNGVFLAFWDGQVWFIDDDVPFKELSKFFTRTGSRRFQREDELGEYCIKKYARYR